MHIFSKAFYSITLRYPILFFDNVHIKAHAIYRKARVSIFLRQHIPVVQLEQYQLYNLSYTSCTTGIVRVAHPVASLLKRYPYCLRMETFRCRQEEKNTFSGTTDRKSMYLCGTSRKDARVIEWAGLEIRWTACPFRGFESHSFRNNFVVCPSPPQVESPKKKRCTEK